MNAFGEKGDRTIDEAISRLEIPQVYKKPDTWPEKAGYEQHIPRWEAERKSALAWLKKYREQHFS
jgi:hypothetical protein